MTLSLTRNSAAGLRVWQTFTRCATHDTLLRACSVIIDDAEQSIEYRGAISHLAYIYSTAFNEDAAQQDIADYVGQRLILLACLSISSLMFASYIHASFCRLENGR